MTDEELRAIKARAAAATPGPWWWTSEDGDLVGSGRTPCACEFRDHGCSPIVETDMGVYGPCVADRAFIAHARTDVPALVAEVERLKALVQSAWEEAYEAGQRSVRGIEATPVVWVNSETRKALGGA